MDKNRVTVLLVWVTLVSTSLAMFFPSRGTIAGSEPVRSLDDTPPVAVAGPDRIVDENETVLFDGSHSTDDVGIVNYTWLFSGPPDPSLYTLPETRLVLPFTVTDAVFDPIRPYVYVSDYDHNRVHFINLEAGSVEKTFNVSLPPESVTINPNASTLYVALLTRPHSSYWYDNEGHEGYIARFDLEAKIKEAEFHITEDPFDMVATDDGFLVVASGSGQWTYARVYYGPDGTETGKCGSVPERLRLALHPSGTKIYAADTGLSPSDIRRLDYTPGGIQYKWDSPYHGEHRMYQNVWASPRGDVVITRGGDVFTLADTRDKDMIFLTEMSESTITDVAFDVESQTIFTSQGHFLHFYDIDNYTEMGLKYFGEEARFIGVRGQWVYGLMANGTGTTISAIPHPMRGAYGSFVQHVFLGPGQYTVKLTVKDAAGNYDSDFVSVTVVDSTPPIADAGDDRTILQGQSALFDGRGSTDNIGIVKYTWTFNDGQERMLDGVYRKHYFNEVGEYTITLTVRDEMGHVDIDWLTVHVNPIPLVMHENAPKGFRIGIYPGWDVEIDKEVEDAGIVDLVAYGPFVDSIRTNVIVASETGPVKETDNFLMEEADDMISELSKEVGTCDVISSPEIIETTSSRVAVFEVQYRDVALRQRIAVVVNESQNRMWAIIITTGPNYNETMSLTFDAIIQSLEFVEPPFISTPAGQGMIGALFSILLGIFAGGFYYLWRRRQPAVMENSEVIVDGEQTMPQQEMTSETSTQSAELPDTYCTNCGTKLRSPYNYCTMCGMRSL